MLETYNEEHIYKKNFRLSVDEENNLPYSEYKEINDAIKNGYKLKCIGGGTKSLYLEFECVMKKAIE